MSDILGFAINALFPFALGLGILAFVALFAELLGWIMDRPVRELLMILVVLYFLFMLVGCVLPKEPCMTGFEIGINGGQSDGRQFGEPYSEENIGGHATVYFDTTGACRAWEE